MTSVLSTLSKPTMHDDLLTQFYESLSAADVIDEWLVDPLEGSTQSSPEITTPIEPQLAVVGNQKDPQLTEILDSPLFGVSSPPAGPTSAMLSPEQASQLFLELSSLSCAFPTLAPMSSSPLSVTAMTPVSTPGAIMSPTTPLSYPLATPLVNSALPSPALVMSTRPRKRSSSASAEPGDEVAVKRQKNTDAARRSRLRKVLKMEALESKVAELEAAQAQFFLRIAVLESEKASLQAKEANQENRIKTLEAQLAEAHKVLASGRS